MAFVLMILIGAVPFLDALIIEFSTTKKFPGTQTEFVWSVIAGIVLLGCIAACCISAVGLLQRWESRMGFLEGRRARWWLFVLIPLTLLAVVLLLLVVYFWIWWYNPHYNLPTVYQPYYLAAGTVLSVVTAAYCMMELVRCVRARPSLVTRYLAVMLIVCALTTSFVSMGVGSPKERSVNSGLISDLRLIDTPIDPIEVQNNKINSQIDDCQPTATP